MKPEAQRIAIAEACGWTFIKDAIAFGEDAYEVDEVGDVWLKPGQEWDNYSPDTQREVLFLQEPSDYLNDLNVMHEAENVLTASQLKQYESHLFVICDDWPSATRATAAQRAEAFLRTIGKWKDGA